MKSTDQLHLAGIRSMVEALEDTPLGETPKEASDRARVRSWRPEADQCLRWESWRVVR